MSTLHIQQLSYFHKNIWFHIVIAFKFESKVCLFHQWQRFGPLDLGMGPEAPQGQALVIK